MNRSYAAYTGGASTVGIDTLAGRGTRQVGRGPGDVDRIAAQQRRRGNVGLTVQLGLMGKQQQFADTQGDKRFGQTKELRGIDQAFQAEQTKQQQGFEDQQGDKRFGQTKELRGLDEDFQTQRDEKKRGWDQEDQRNQGIESVYAMPLPDGSGYVPMAKDKMGRVSNVGGFMPTKQAVKQPTLEEHAKQFSDSLAKGMVPSWDGSKYTYTELKPAKPEDGGSETTTFDDKGNVVQKQTRKKLKPGEQPSAPPAGGAAQPPSAFLNSLGGGQ